MMTHPEVLKENRVSTMRERLLYNKLSQLDDELARQFDRIYEEAFKIWDEQHLRQFTIHGKKHTDQVERNLDSLTAPIQNSEKPLSAEEIFVLLSACCLHDIGMQLDVPDARAKHAQYSYELILNSSAQIGPELRRVTLTITDNNKRRAIALVARAHWTDFALRLDSESFISDNESGRLRLLGLLLAMADLLDISPVRARYFRSLHRLYDLDPVSELHQKMHDLVRGFRIRPPNPTIDLALQFQLEWSDDSQIVYELSDWIMKWFHSQWRQIRPALYEESGGLIGWTQPWAVVTFNPAEGPVQKLSQASINVLRAEMAEQARIDRDQFVEQFQDSIKLGEAALFLTPINSDLDGRALADYCEAQARLREHCMTARIVIQPHAQMELSSVISGLLEQWGGHLKKCSDRAALRFLKSFLSENKSKSFVTIIVSPEYDEKTLIPLLEILARHSSRQDSARVCILLVQETTKIKQLSRTSIYVFDGTEFSQEDVKHHFQMRCGYNEYESEELYRKLARIGIVNKPGKIYDFIEEFCWL